MNRVFLAAWLALAAGCEGAGRIALPPSHEKSRVNSSAEAPLSSSETAPAEQNTPAPEAAPAFADPPAALAALKTAISSDDQPTIRAATVWLTRQGAAAVEPAAAEVQNPENDLRYRLACLNVLGFLGPDAAPALLEATHSESAPVRIRAADALGNVRPVREEIVDRLLVLLGDGDDELRRAAAQSLGRIGPPARKAAPKLQAILNSDADDSLRGAAKTALLKVDRRVGFRDD